MNNPDPRKVYNLDEYVYSLAGFIFIDLFICGVDIYQTQVNLGSDLWVRISVSERGCWDFTDVTLADEDTNSILADNVKGAIQGNEAMQVM